MLMHIGQWTCARDENFCLKKAKKIKFPPGLGGDVPWFGVGVGSVVVGILRARAR